MIKPFTCICLALAAGSGLYLYQVKQRAFALDAQLRTTFHDIDVAREKTRMLRADWALMNDPERLQSLANQYLALKPMGPSQLLTLDQLAVALPAPVAPSATPPVVPPDATAPAVADPTHGAPMALATPAPAASGAPDQAVALLQPSDMAATAAPAAPAPSATMAAIDVLPPDVPPPAPPLPAMAAPSVPVQTARLAAVIVPPSATASARRVARHDPAPSAPRPAVVTQSALAAAPAPHPAVTAHKPRTLHPAAPAGQLYAANEPVRQPYAAPRITPSASTVIYRPVTSSLGMAGGGTLAPPRPLYSTTQ